MLIKFSSLFGGVFIEVTPDADHTAGARCFRFDKSGNAEYAVYCDLVENRERARWFGHCFKESDFTFA